MGEGLKRARAAARATQEVLAPSPPGYVVGWNHKIEEMPTTGTFEVLKIYDVNRFDREGVMVVEPKSGRMFRPLAWRRKR